MTTLPVIKMPVICTCTECYGGFSVQPGTVTANWVCDGCKPGQGAAEQRAVRLVSRRVELAGMLALLVSGVVVSSALVVPAAYSAGGFILAAVMFAPGALLASIASYFALLPVACLIWAVWWMLSGRHE